MLKIKKPKTKLRLFIGLLILAVLCGAVYYFFNIRDTSVHTAQNPKINYGPPTKADTQNVNDNKQRIVQEQENSNNQTPNSPGTKRNLKPVITYAGEYGSTVQIGGYESVFEDGGTCTATFTSGGTTVTKSVQAVRDVSSTDCPTISINTVEFNPRGQYLVTLSYDSATTTGVSDSQTIEVK